MKVTKLELKPYKKNLPVQVAKEAGGVRLTLGPTLQVNATCKAEGPAPRGAAAVTDPRAAPWKLGFMQARVAETRWSYFRGKKETEGCVLLDQSAPPTLKICRDYEPRAQTVWYECTDVPADSYCVPDWSKPGPWEMECFFGDSPKSDCYEHVVNPNNQLYNALYEARTALGFVTTFTELQEGEFKHHKHFFWSVVWHIQATGVPAQPFKFLPGSGFWLSGFKDGAPRDNAVLNVLNNAAITPSCNEIAANTRVEKSVSSTWTRFPVMDRKEKLF